MESVKQEKTDRIINKNQIDHCINKISEEHPEMIFLFDGIVNKMIELQKRIEQLEDILEYIRGIDMDISNN